MSKTSIGDLDHLLIDTPPGTSDEHLSIIQYLKETGITGAVIVTTPQEVALQDVRKEIDFCRKVKVPIIGVVENMAGFVCPKCGVSILGNRDAEEGQSSNHSLYNCFTH